MGKRFGRFSIIAALLSIGCMVMVTACTKHTAKRAGEGATMGAVVGGVGGLVTGLVFGGDVAESTARGAVYGASTGAAAGAITGARDQSQMDEQQQADIEKLKAQIGVDAFNGLAALAECKHDVALANARAAAKQENQDYALAGLWLEVLTLADSREEGKARELFPKLVENDDKLSSTDDAEESMRQTLQKLMDIRGEYDLPKVCN
jgi:hypothetical protein